MKKHILDKKNIIDILQWDVESWAPILCYWEQALDWSNLNLGLELGGRQGGLSLWLGLKGMQVLCSDLKDAASTALPLHIDYKVEPFIQYQDIDATSIPFVSHFDIIVFKSVIGGIGRNDNSSKQHQVFNQIHRALKPGGVLLFAENLTGSYFHRILRKRGTKWGDAWRYVTLNEINAFLEPFSEIEIKSTGVIGCLGRSETQRALLAKLDRLLLNRICPPSWNYIVYGIARK